MCMERWSTRYWDDCLVAHNAILCEPKPPHNVYSISMSLRTLLAFPLLASACLAQHSLFETTQVWTVNLAFTQDQWKALEPANRPGSHNIDFGRGEWLQ